jgi:hypothetical protein
MFCYFLNVTLTFVNFHQVAELPCSDKDSGDLFSLSLKLLGKELTEQLETSNSDCELSFNLDVSGCYWKNAQKSNFWLVLI